MHKDGNNVERKKVLTQPGISPLVLPAAVLGDGREAEAHVLLALNGDSEGKGSVCWFFPLSPDPAAAAQDRQAPTSLGLILQQQAFRMMDNFSEALQVLKAVLQ